jgi:HEPN domain-containing protein
MLNRWKSLVREAEKQLLRAEAANAASKPVWAWFAAHQSAEKAVKALRLKYNLNGHERMVTRLLVTMPETVAVPPELLHKAHLLDSHYLPVQLTPAELHTPRSNGRVPSDEAVRVAAEIIAFVKTQLENNRGREKVTPLKPEPRATALEVPKEGAPSPAPVEPMTA